MIKLYVMTYKWVFVEVLRLCLYCLTDGCVDMEAIRLCPSSPLSIGCWLTAGAVKFLIRRFIVDTILQRCLAQTHQDTQVDEHSLPTRFAELQKWAFRQILSLRLTKSWVSRQILRLALKSLSDYLLNMAANSIFNFHPLIFEDPIGYLFLYTIKYTVKLLIDGCLKMVL